MIPHTIREWTITAIVELLTKGYYESEKFDFKESLPHSKDIDGKQRLTKSCCAFANGQGGFLVFGISDSRSISAEDRLIGLDRSLEVPEHFGNFPKKCIPSINWHFMNPPLELENGKVIHVIEIPTSWERPHSIKDEADKLLFLKRTNKGNEAMSYEEIRLHFLGYYEKRIKLQLLQAELQNIIDDAKALTIPPGKAIYSLTTFDLTVIETTLVDVYTVLANEPEIIGLLHKIRNDCRRVNNKLQIFYSYIALEPGAAMWPAGTPSENCKYQIEWHNEFIRNNCREIIESSEQAFSIIQRIVAL
jgi:hypothetical protein